MMMVNGNPLILRMVTTVMNGHAMTALDGMTLLFCLCMSLKPVCFNKDEDDLFSYVSISQEAQDDP